MNPKKLITDRNNIFVSLVIAAAIVAGLTVSAVSAIETSSQQENYSTWVKVNESDGQNITAGFATGQGLAYGEIAEGTNITKSLELSSSDLTIVNSNSEGNISEGLRYNERTLFQNSTSIDYEYFGSEPGYYTGNIILNIKTADNYWGEKWLELLYRSPF